MLVAEVTRGTPPRQDRKFDYYGGAHGYLGLRWDPLYDLKKLSRERYEQQLLSSRQGQAYWQQQMTGRIYSPATLNRLLDTADKARAMVPGSYQRTAWNHPHSMAATIGPPRRWWEGGRCSNGRYPPR